MAHEPESVRRRAGRAIPRARSDEMALTRESSSDSGATGLALGLTPSGTLALRAAPDADPLDPAAASRIEAAFALGAGHGLLHLGAAEVDTPLPPGFAFWRDLGRAFVTQLCAMPDRRREPQAPASPVARSRDPGARRGRAADGGRRVPGHRRARGVLGGDERGVPRRARRVRRAAGGVSALAARRLARGGTRALPPRGEPRRSRGAVRVPRDLQHASHQAGQGAAPSARRGDPRVRGRGQPRQAPGPARARADRGGAESPVARAGGFGRRVSAARPDARRRVPIPPRHPRLRGIGRGGAGARLVGRPSARRDRRCRSRSARARRAGSAPTRCSTSTCA